MAKYNPQFRGRNSYRIYYNWRPKPVENPKIDPDRIIRNAEKELYQKYIDAWDVPYFQFFDFRAKDASTEMLEEIDNDCGPVNFKENDRVFKLFYSDTTYYLFIYRLEGSVAVCRDQIRNKHIAGWVNKPIPMFEKHITDETSADVIKLNPHNKKFGKFIEEFRGWRKEGSLYVKQVQRG